MTLKRFALFSGDVFYPQGGWEDLAGTYDSVEEASAEGERRIEPQNSLAEWWHVIDLQTGERVAGDEDS